MYYKYFVLATLGLFFGIIFAFKLNFSSEIFILSFILCPLGVVLYKFSKRSFGVYKSEMSLIISCFSFFLSMGILLGQYDISKDQIRKENFLEFISENNSLYTGEIIKLDKNEVSQQIVLKLDSTDYKIKVVTQNFPVYKIGEKLEVNGKLILTNDQEILLPDPSLTEKGFNIKDKNNLENIDGNLVFPKIEKIGFASGFFISLSDFKSSFIEILKNNLDISVAALNAGVLLGDDSMFTKEEINNFRISSLSHIIVLSGFNISIIIICLSILFSFMSLRYRVSFTIIALIIFILFVGVTPSIVRAGIMGSVLLIANIFAKQYVAKQALFISAFIMMFITPKIALYDVSFHLSFLATFGILYLLPIFENMISRFLRKEVNADERELNFILKNLLEIFKTTLAAQIMVMPYIMYIFGKVSVFGLIANILVIPAVPIIMLLGFLIICFSILSYLLSFIWLSFLAKIFLIIFSYLDFIFSHYVFLISKFISSISFSQITNYISGYTLFILYLILISIIFFEEKRRRLNF